MRSKSFAGLVPFLATFFKDGLHLECLANFAGQLTGGNLQIYHSGVDESVGRIRIQRGQAEWAMD